MDRYDIIVIGGGPAGATAAHHLARSGMRVLILDSATFPRVKLCAGWVTAQVWENLGLKASEYPGTLQPFDRATLELGGKVRETRWDRTVSYGIIRSEFDHYLIKRAHGAGAEIRTDSRVEALTREPDGWSIAVGDTRFHARTIIGAGGHRCPVARQLGQIDPEEAVVMARESETRLTSSTLQRITATPGIPELIVEEDLNGYGWIFSKGDFLNIGVGCIDDGRSLNERCNALLCRLRQQQRLPDEINLEPFRGHAYTVRMRAPRRPAGDDWLLAGDAAGLARPLSGEGIGPAVASGQLAAKSILEGRVAHYPEALAAAFGSGHPGPLAALAGQLPRPLLNGAGRIVCHQPQLRRKLVFEGAFGMTEV